MAVAYRTVLLMGLVAGMAGGVAAAPGSVASGTGWGEVVGGLQCRAALAPHGEPSADAPALELAFRNVGGQPLGLFAPGGSFWRFVEVTQDGQSVRRTDEREDWNIQEQRQHFVHLGPGETRTIPVSVKRGWNPERPLSPGGLVVTYRNPNKNGRAFGLTGWTGTIRCPTVQRAPER